jgi:hypothetical protein
VEEKMKKTALVVLAAFILGTASGYAATKPRLGPPLLRVEVITLRPGPNHVWVAGYWKWSGLNYAWSEGRWVKVKPNRAWAPGKWKQVGSYWAWTPGRWERINIGGPKPAKKKKR